jgi:sialate O-acetylesterase
MQNIKRFLLGAAVLCAAAPLARADVKLPAIISDNMVLQAGATLPIWGWADAGEQVTVTLGDQKKTATPADGGKWMVKLDPVKAGGPVEMTIAGKNSIAIKNILVGEVWVCSGQSNMEWTVANAHNVTEEAPKANFPQLRQFLVQKATSYQPKTDVVGNWVECSPETVKGFTAVGYFFGKDIHKALGVPVGLVHTSWGGTVAQAWTTLEGLKSEPALVGPYVENLEKTLATLPQAKERYEAALKAWNENGGKNYGVAMAKWRNDVAEAKAAGKPAPPKPAQQPPANPEGNPNVSTVLNNAMIAPLVPYAIKGAIWYQGESNAGQAMLYRTLFPTMIKDWLLQWGQGDFGFYWVQLANFMDRTPEPTQKEDGWPGLREAQSMTLALPNTGEAVIIDVGEAKDIHPRNKETVGQRLALNALKVTYGKEVVHSGPRYDSMSAQDNKVTLKFKHVGGGLVIGAAPIIKLGQEPNKPADKLVGFSIAGADKNFVWANAKIEGDTVVVWSDTVSKPVAVRYAWANNPECNLYNKEGIPASPFRTDDWTSAPPQGKK